MQEKEAAKAITSINVVYMQEKEAAKAITNVNVQYLSCA